MLVKAKKAKLESRKDYSLILFGVSHKNSNIEQREKLHFDQDSKLKILEKIKSLRSILECSIICTCNRSELVLVVDSISEANSEDLKRELEKETRKILIHSSSTTESCNIDIPEFYTFSNTEAIKHFYSVTCGIDSLIPGEQQIAAQQKDSYKLAKKNNFAGLVLNRLYQSAFAISKSVRSSTAIGRKAVSVSYAAKELSSQIFGDLDDVSVMLIGAGKTGALAAKHLYASGVRKFTIVNRTYDNALDLAKAIGARVVDFDNYLSFISESDIIIGAVTCKDPYLVKEEVEKLSKSRQAVSQFFIDLGVPRNFETSISEIPDVFLYTVDDLENVVRQNINSRTMEFSRAEMIIDEEVASFNKWFSNLDLREDIKELVLHFESLAKEESKKTLNRLQKAGYTPSPELKEAIEVLSNSIVSKIIHSPIQKIREKVDDK